MNRLGIIACQVYEKELARLIDNDERIDVIYALDNDENRHFAQYLKCKEMRFVEEFDLIPEQGGDIVLLDILPIALHVYIKELIDRRTERINHLRDRSDSILILYGLCGDSSQKVFDRHDVSMFAPKDGGGVVDDCVCSLLGKAEYLKQLKNVGSFFLIPGFVIHAEELNSKVYGPKAGRDGFKMVLEATGYRRFMLIDHGLWNDCEMEGAIDEANCIGLPLEKINGDISILQRCFEEAMGSLKGR